MTGAVPLLVNLVGWYNAGNVTGNLVRDLARRGNPGTMCSEGGVEVVDLSSFNVSSMNYGMMCSGRGTCVNGNCSCLSPFRGAYCEFEGGMRIHSSTFISAN